LHIHETIKKNFNGLMKNFLQNSFIITNNKNDRVPKDSFIHLYNNTYGTKLLWNHLLPDIKRLGLVYDKNRRWGSTRGVILGIQYAVQDTAQSHDSHIDD